MEYAGCLFPGGHIQGFAWAGSWGWRLSLPHDEFYCVVVHLVLDERRPGCGGYVVADAFCPSGGDLRRWDYWEHGERRQSEREVFHKHLDGLESLHVPLAWHGVAVGHFFRDNRL